MSWDIVPITSLYLIVLVGGALLALSLLRMLRERGTAAFKRQILPVALRLILLVALVAIALNPVRLSSRNAGDKPRLFVLLDRSVSMTARDGGKAARDGGQMSRFEMALETLRASREKLQSHFVLETRVFDSAALAVEPELLTPDAAIGEETDIASALMQTIADVKTTETGAGILLISDGRSTAGEPDEAAQLGLARSIPVWTWCLGGEVATQDVWLRAAASELLAFAQDEVEIVATAHQEGYPSAAMTVELWKDRVAAENPDALIDRQLVIVEPGQPAQVAFRFTAPDDGEHRYVLRVEPQPGEADPYNNEQSVFVRVVGQKVKVLLIEGEAHWDTKFLVQALKQHERVDLTAIYRLGPQRYSAIISEHGQFRRETTNLFPKTAKELSEYDICILGRSCETFFADDTEEMLTDFIARRGGGLIFSRGKPYNGRFYPLAKLEPVVWNDGIEEAVSVQLTAAAATNSVFELGEGTGAGNSIDELLARLPLIDQARQIRGEKPLSVVLATSDHAPQELQPNILMAYQRYGQGKVVTVNMTGIWRWAFREETRVEEEEVYTRFWMSLLRWLLSDVDFLPGADVALRSESRYYTEKQRIQLHIATRGIEPQRYTPRLTIAGNGIAEELEPAAGQGGAYSASVGPFEPGSYQVTLYNNIGQPAELSTQIDVLSSSIERRNLSADPDAMRTLAQDADGEALSQEDIARLPQIVANWQQQRQLSDEKTALWDRWWVLLTVLVLLGVEFYLRRREGLL